MLARSETKAIGRSSEDLWFQRETESAPPEICPI